MRSRRVATGSPTWWWRILSDICLRLAAIVVVLIDLISGRVHGWQVGPIIGVIVVMALLLVFPVGACVLVLLKRANQTGRHPGT